MKESLCNNIGLMFINQKNFSIIDTSSMSYSIIKYSLYKEQWGALHIINFSDADRVDFNLQNVLADNISRELSAFKNMAGANPLIYFKVFITQYGLPDSTISNLMRYFYHSIHAKTTFIPIIMDISNARIFNAAPDMDKIGITSLLNSALFESPYFPSFDYLGQVFNNQARSDQNRNNYRMNIKKSPYVTYSLIGANVLMYIIISLLERAGDPYALLRYGAKINEFIVAGEYWRLLTSAFLHANLAHIAFNMYGLYNLGTLSEKLYGSKKYAFIYFSAALVGGASSFAFSKAPSVGASGAIFGLFGAILYVWRKKRGLFNAAFGINLVVVLAFNIINGLTTPGIDNFAHLGGLVGGYMASGAAGLRDGRGYSGRRILFGISLAGIFMVLLVFGMLMQGDISPLYK